MKIDYESARNCARKLTNSAVQDMQDMMKKGIGISQTEIPESWKGKDADAFLNSLGQLIKETESICQDALRLGKNIQDTADELEELERRTAAAMAAAAAASAQKAMAAATAAQKAVAPAKLPPALTKTESAAKAASVVKDATGLAKKTVAESAVKQVSDVMKALSGWKTK